MARILVTLLLVLAWHFPTTYFVPGGPPNERGWFAWPFGTASEPVFGAVPGVLGVAAAGVASIAFIVAIAALWGLAAPSEWWRPACTIGAVASAVLFVAYLGPWAVAPLIIDAIVLWAVWVAGWTPAQLATT